MRSLTSTGRRLRLAAGGLVAAGLALIAASTAVEPIARPGWFWSDENRQADGAARERFDRLYAAYVTELKRRAAAGRPPLAEEPEALRRARARLAETSQSLTEARQRPPQIATALRLAGALCCAAAVLLMAFARRRRSAATSPSEGAEGQ